MLNIIHVEDGCKMNVISTTRGSYNSFDLIWDGTWFIPVTGEINYEGTGATVELINEETETLD